MPESSLIKKYANRRLYDTRESRYITVADIRRMVEKKQHFTVVDAKTGEDLTRTVLMQVINDYEAFSADSIMPISMLRQVVQLYGSKFAQQFVAFVEENLIEFMKQLDQHDLIDAALLATMKQPLNDELVARLVGAGGQMAAPLQSDSTPLDELRSEIRSLQEKLDALTQAIET
ncbi:MAG: hypothetical protein J4A00_01090 [Gammaproteobacteria bacterium]|nr:hypothetical protein [Gammaproteobacteria bacterium]